MSIAENILWTSNIILWRHVAGGWSYCMDSDVSIFSRRYLYSRCFSYHTSIQSKLDYYESDKENWVPVVLSWNGAKLNYHLSLGCSSNGCSQDFSGRWRMNFHLFIVIAKLDIDNLIKRMTLRSLLYLGITCFWNLLNAKHCTFGKALD